MKHPEILFPIAVIGIAAPVAAKANEVTSMFNKFNLIGVSPPMLAVTNLPALGSSNDKIDTRFGVNGIHIYPLAADQAARPDNPAPRIANESRNYVEDVFNTLSRNVERIQTSEFGKLPTVRPKLQNISASARNLQMIFKAKGRRIPPDYMSGLNIDAREMGKVADKVSAKHALPVRPRPGWPIVEEKTFVAFLAPRANPQGSAPAGTKTQVFLTEADKPSIQTIEDVRLDLYDKVSFAEKNPWAPFASVKINVITRNKAKKEISGYEVWYALKASFDDKGPHHRFNKKSSPTSEQLPPGNYVFWTQSVSTAESQRQRKDIGYDGRPETSVDPLLVP